MRSLQVFLATLLVVLVAGCSNVSIKNPFTTPTLAQVETAYGAVLSVAVNYRDACAQRVIPSSCRLIVPKLQEYGRKAQIAVIAARNFVKNYPQLDPVSSLLAAQQAIADFRNYQTSQGVK